MAYQSLQEIIDTGTEQKIPFWRAVLLDDASERNTLEEDSIRTMEKMWEAMKSASENYDGSLRSRSTLVGGMGAKMEAYRKNDRPLCGEFVSKVMMLAIQMAESNACMKRIVAAPTAGSCGVLPAVLIGFYQDEHISDEKIVEALYVAAGVGQVIATRAFIAGAAGGCQAEIGSASAMAAGALVHLRGGDAEQIAHAAGIALKNLLGLVCDPVAGLVEVPCVKRNVIGAVNALSAADMALAGICCQIPPDQIIDAMKEVGEAMHVSLRETGEGGVANTPWAKAFAEKLK